MLPAVENLLKENESDLLSERRGGDKKPFVRPATIRAGRNQDVVAFAISKDLSRNGIGLISQVEWKERTFAQGEILSTEKHEVHTVNVEALWTRPFGDNWYYTAWKFVDDRQ